MPMFHVSKLSSTTDEAICWSVAAVAASNVEVKLAPTVVLRKNVLYIVQATK